MIAIAAAAGKSDIAHIARLAYEVWNEHYPAIIGQAQVDYMLPRDYGVEVIAGELAARQIRWDIARWYGEPIGFASYGPFDAVDGDLWLRKLYVLAVQRGTGAGWALTARVLGAAAEHGFRQVALRVNKSNALAIRRYQRMGFAVRESDVKQIGNGFVMDDYIMSWPIGAIGPQEGAA